MSTYSSSMSVDALQPSPRRLARTPGPPVMPKPVLAKGQEFPRPASSPGARKPSAVERLEADKAKYVKSQQVVLTKQQPIRSPVIRKPLMSPGNAGMCRPGATPPTRKVPLRPIPQSEGLPLNLEHLSELISGVSDSPSPSAPPEERGSPGDGSGCTSSLSSSSSTPPALQAEPHAPRAPARGTPVKALADGPSGSPTVAVRRVDVRPQVPLARKPCRMQLQSRLPAQLPPRYVQSQLLRLLKPHSQLNPALLLPDPAKYPGNTTPLRHGPAHLPNSPTPAPALLPNSPTPLMSPPPKLPNTSTQLAPVPVQLSSTPAPIQNSPASLHSSLATLLPSHAPLPPPSPAATRLSSGSSRKRPSLSRSKSDVSDRFSRAGADLERFFNYCGLDPADLDELARPGSDMASVSRLRSASMPASECTAEEEEEAELQGVPAERPTYGISVIERNARVIKWLYSMRQARDSARVANM